jgi:1,4-alpha-glucan branching enzyme
MYLIQILLPLYNNEGDFFPSSSYASVKKELTENFSGLTAYTRSPATGLWKENETKTVKDEIVIYEVMLTELDRVWWKNFKESLEEKFLQDEIIIRATQIELL